MYEVNKKYNNNCLTRITRHHSLIWYIGIFVAIAGIGILGEGAKLFAPRSERFNNKERMLKIYNSMNENIAKSFSIPFIDVRRTLSKKIPFFQLCYKNCVTYDGEHSNERGALVIAKLFAEVLSKWLTSS